MEKIHIQIDKPCSENFKTFKKTVEGGFCNSCKKNVIDFTKMKDQEIIEYFSIKKSKTCGLFLDSQLKNFSNQNLSSNGTKSSAFVSSIFSLSLISLLSLTNVYSQDRTNLKETIKLENDVTKQDSNSVDSNKKITVNGIVSDKIGPLPGATVYSKKYNIGTQTDFDGKFTFPKQLETGDLLLVTYIGYKDQEIKISTENNSISMSYDVKLDNSQMVMMGAVTTNKVYKSKRTILQKIKSLFTND